LGGGGSVGVEDAVDREMGGGIRDGGVDGSLLPPPNVDSIPRPLSPTKLTPVGKVLPSPPGVDPASGQCVSVMHRIYSGISHL